MARRSPEAEARYKAYQKKYHAERNARARYSYERLEKVYRVTVKGKNLSAEFMQSRAPGVTGETPWEKDLTVHPRKWRRYGMPKDLPTMVDDYKFEGKRVRRFFIDPRMHFDCSLISGTRRGSSTWYDATSTASVFTTHQSSGNESIHASQSFVRQI